jgi:hypothetical protein
MSKKIIVAALFSLLATAGTASEAVREDPAPQRGTHAMECTCAPSAATASPLGHKADKVTTMVVKQPKVQSNIDLNPEDYR